MDIPIKVVLSDEEARDRIDDLKLKALQAQFIAETAKYEGEEANRVATEAEEQAQLAIELAAEAKVQAARSFRIVMSGMRTSYLLFAGMGRIMGGGMTMLFRTMYAAMIAGVGTFKALTATALATPGGQLQALLMAASLGVVIMQLTGVITAQSEFARNMRGFNMMLHGISGMIGTYHVV